MTKPLIIQSDHTILAETDSPLYTEARDQLCRFAELVKSPEHVHTYALTRLSIWNAASVGMKLKEILETLQKYSKYPIPTNVKSEMESTYNRYGKLILLPGLSGNILEQNLLLKINDPHLAKELRLHPKISSFLIAGPDDATFEIRATDRGNLKQVCVKLGYPIVDEVGFIPGEKFSIPLRDRTKVGIPFGFRDYQLAASDMFFQGGSVQGGHGVVVLPCGAGKTIVGIKVMAQHQCRTLIVVTSVAAINQWIREILDKTDLTSNDVGEYSGQTKDIKPVTVATYNILTYSGKSKRFDHFALFNQAGWGLIIYDEVHLLPAPLFSMTAGLQSRRRLGLTATLVREDGREDDVFSLIGPKRFDAPWKELEGKGWIAEATCTEIRVPFIESAHESYIHALDQRVKYRVASTNPGKMTLIRELLTKHKSDLVLIIGQYLDQLDLIEKTFGFPMITGKTPNVKREELFKAFREKKITTLIVSRVANFSIDLPDANVLIQVSGLYGSRQEEAQRLGRILRPKSGRTPAYFYTLVTADTMEQETARHRQLFLVEQGYRYEIIERKELVDVHD